MVDVMPCVAWHGCCRFPVPLGTCSALCLRCVRVALVSTLGTHIPRAGAQDFGFSWRHVILLLFRIYLLWKEKCAVGNGYGNQKSAVVVSRMSYTRSHFVCCLCIMHMLVLHYYLRQYLQLKRKFCAAKR